MKKYLILAIFIFRVAQAQPHHCPHKPIERMMEWKEKQEEAIEFISKYMKEPDKLKKLQQKYPMKYKKILLHAIKEKRRLDELKEIEPEIYEIEEGCFKLEVRVRELAENYKETEDKNKKEEIKKDISGLVNELFDLREKRDKLKIKKLEEELSKMKEITAKRNKNKEEIIKRHIEELLLGEEYIRW